MLAAPVSRAVSASSTRRSPSSPPSPTARARWPSWSTRTGCPARPRTAWPSPWRCTGCSPATPRAASCSGARLGELAAALPDPLIAAAGPVLAWVRDECGESAQLYRRDGAERVCVAAAERATGLRTTVPVGARLPLTAGLGRAGAVRLVRAGRAWPTCCAGAEFTARDAGRGAPARLGPVGRPARGRASRRCRRRCSAGDGSAARRDLDLRADRAARPQPRPALRAGPAWPGPAASPPP